MSTSPACTRCVSSVSTATTVPQKMSALFGATLAILVLAPFSFLFVCIPLFFIMVLLCCLWPMAFFLAVSLPFVLIVLALMMFQVGFKLLALLCLLFFAMGWSSMVVAVVVGLSLVSVFLFQGLARFFQWNIDLIKKQVRS